MIFKIIIKAIKAGEKAICVHVHMSTYIPELNMWPIFMWGFYYGHMNGEEQSAVQSPLPTIYFPCATLIVPVGWST